MLILIRKMASSYEFVRKKFNISSDSENIYCICRSSDISTFMISCDFCQEWYHGDCVGVREEKADSIDLYCCKKCTSLNPNLRTTYKENVYAKKNKKHDKRKKHVKPTKQTVLDEPENKLDNDSNSSGFNNLDEEVDCVSEKAYVDLGYSKSLKDEELAFIFEMDTTKRRAKKVAKNNIKRHNVSVKEAKTKKKKEQPPVQCLGPGCIYPVRQNSKYCSDECGMRLGTNRILEILPLRLEQKKLLPSAADEISQRKLSAVRRQQKIIYLNLEEIDIKISQLVHLVHKSKHSKDDAIAAEHLEDDNTTVDCKLCGLEVPTRTAMKHMECCYRKQERRVLLTGTSTKLDDIEWNIFCNHRMGRQGYCKQLRVLCPLHYRDANKAEEEVCGYPLVMNLSECSGKFCGSLKKNCSKHPSCWEDIFRAELDMEKLQLLLKLSDLEKEEQTLRQEMAARGNLMALLLHQTIVH